MDVDAAEPVAEVPGVPEKLEVEQTTMRPPAAETPAEPASETPVSSSESGNHSDCNGVVVNLEYLEFPGLDNLPASYVARFRECGLGKHTAWESGKHAESFWQPIRDHLPK